MAKMYQLMKVVQETYYIYCPTNMGIYLRDNGKAVVIDTGNSSNVGKEIRKILDEQGWELECIINTHSHADHISGNAYLQNRYKVPIYANAIEGVLGEHTRLLPSMIYGGNPPEKLLNQALFARPSRVTHFSHPDFPEELKVLDLKGHSPDQIGIEMPNKTIYLGDAVVREDIIKKYHVSFIYNVKEYRETLDLLETLEADWYLLSHSEPKQDLTTLIQVNRDKTFELEEKIWEFCRTPATFEEIVAEIVTSYEIFLNLNQYHLTCHTLKGYLTNLFNENKIQPSHQRGKEYWEQT